MLYGANVLAFGHSFEPMAVMPSLPNEDSIVRLIGAVLLEANDESQLQHRYMQVEAMADLNTPAIEEEKQLQIIPKAA